MHVTIEAFNGTLLVSLFTQTFQDTVTACRNEPSDKPSSEIIQSTRLFIILMRQFAFVMVISLARVLRFRAFYGSLRANL